MAGSLTVMNFKRGPDMVYVEGSRIGEFVRESDELAHYAHTYDLLQAGALPPDESLAVIHNFMEEYRAWAPREPR